jgi:hypothetical protein
VPVAQSTTSGPWMNLGVTWRVLGSCPLSMARTTMSLKISSAALPNFVALNATPTSLCFWIVRSSAAERSASRVSVDSRTTARDAWVTGIPAPAATRMN